MTISKITLTKEQAAAIELFLEHHKGDKAFLLNLHAQGNQWTGKIYPAMNGLDQSDMARALLIGYDVELGYKAGDYVVRKDGETFSTRSRVAKVAKLFSDNAILIVDGGTVPFANIRHATPEEIKAEKERQLWASLGREVGEFKVGDVYLNEFDVPVHIPTLERLELFKKEIHERRLKGFFPAESFISFEDGEEE